MLAQGCERIKLQLQNEPCGNTNGLIPDIDMNDVSPFLLNSTFNLQSEWTEQEAIVAYNDGFVIFRPIPASSNISLITKQLPNVGETGGVTVCRLRFTISDMYLNPDGVFWINVDDGINPTPAIRLYASNPIPGDYDLFCYVPNGYTNLSVGFAAPTGSTLFMTRISLQPIAVSWSVAIDANGLAEALTQSNPSFTYDNLGGSGRFIANPNWAAWAPLSDPYTSLIGFFDSSVADTQIVEVKYTITNMTNGFIYPELGTNQGITRSINGVYTDFIASGGISDRIIFWTTQDFDGTISNISVKIFGYCHTFDVLDATDDSIVAGGIRPRYVNDKINFNINPCSILVITGGEPNDIQLTDGCYKIRFNNCCDEESYTSDTVINYTRGEHDCTVLVDASCDDKAFGFDFSNGFSLSQRLRVLRFNPTYKNEGEDSQGSDGVKRRPFARSEKVYSCIFDYCDEATHDAINTQLLCDTLTFDGVEYFCPIKDYQPEWADRGRLNLAQSQIELQKKQSVIYNRNCI
jgi:hypothetical protein